jgi:GT2 family glycosyltransferase
MCRVSVIVPTHNRAASLPDHLDRVLGQTHPDYEAIYVNDSSTDGTARVLGEYAAKYPGLLRVVTTDFGAPGPARNAGAAVAGGELLLFADDDVAVPPDWIARMAALHEAHPRGAVCGGIAPASLDTDIERYQHYRMMGALGRTARDAGATPVLNFLVSREAFERAGGFPAEPLRAAEDWEFCKRLRNGGVTIRYDPSVIVTHPYVRELGPLLHRIRDTGAAGVYVWLGRHRGALLYTMYSLVRCVLSPFWAPFTYPMDLYALAVHMEYVFAEARLLAYMRHVSGKAIV